MERSFFFATLICVLLLGSTFAVEDEAGGCLGQTSCSTCTATGGCGWCTATAQCLPGIVSGPINGTCLGTSWQYRACKQCGSMYDCRSCRDFQSDCQWCSATGTCQPLGANCESRPSETCPCDVYQTCSSCVDDLTCMWCGDSLSCMSTTDTCNMPAHTCLCSTNPDCFSCKADYKCNWCDLTGSCVIINDSFSGCAFSHTCNGFCGQLNNCEECLLQTGCSWCSQTSTCVETETSTCAIAHTCPDCQMHTYCGPCLDSGDCVWCSSLQQCRPVGDPCLNSLSCEIYCNSTNSCDECATKKGCGWCSVTSTCEDIDSTGCLITHTCSAIVQHKCGFDGGAFVGGMFLVIGIIGLLVGAFVFYRWKTGKSLHVQYSELK